MYTALVYKAPISNDYSHRILRVKLFELGHSFDYIDSLSLQDLGDITSYWDGKGKGEAKLRSMNKPSKGRRK